MKNNNDKYFLETVNQTTKLPTSPFNRVAVKGITKRQDGDYDINVKFGRHDQRITIPNVLSQQERKVIFRNQYGIAVPPEDVIKSFDEPK